MPAITLLATTSVVLGLDRGVKRLSEINMGLAGALMLFLLLLGPTLAYRAESGWQASWTVFYLAWWIGAPD